MPREINFKTVYTRDADGNQVPIPALMGGGDAAVTKESVTNALGYTAAKEAELQALDQRALFIKEQEAQEIVDVPTWEEHEALAQRVDASDEYIKNKTQKTRIDFDGSTFRIGENVLNFKQLHDIHLDQPDFAFVVYGDRAYLLAYVQDDESAMREMRWESTIATDAAVKTSGIYVTSTDGVDITRVTVRDINSENSASKVTAITDANKSSTNDYPSVKAVVDYAAAKRDFTQLDAAAVKTVNGTAPDANGNVNVSGGSDYDDTEIRQEIRQIADVVFRKSDNLFDVSVQTSDAISPHYFVNGAPYSSTQFDATWHCSAPVEVLPNTQYTIGCVPSFSGVTKPWNNAGEGVFFYDDDMTYLGKINANTFVTPATAKYIRFNYYIKFAGFVANMPLIRCVLVRGNSLPDEYIPFENSDIRKDLNKLSAEVDSLKSTIGFAYKIDLQNREMLVSFKYTNEQDCLIRMACGGGNGLFDFRGMYVLDNAESPKIHDISEVTAWNAMNGDTFAPIQIRAVNNIDGDNMSSTGNYYVYFTGGNHQYNNIGSGSTPTAMCQNLKFYINGFQLVESITGVANEIKVTWENMIQGYNTTKADGSGRAILMERKSVVFDGTSFFCHTELVPLEPIKVVLWYGYQLMHNAKYDKCQYVDGTNRAVYARNAYTNCGDKEAKKLRVFHSINADCMDVEISDFDLGKRNLFTGTNGIFNTDYGKAYFNIINGERDMVEGGVYTLDGKYTFRKGFV